MLSFPIAERFVSINGEGANAGRLAAFIRFPGCNLRCTYCDTQWAQDPELTVEFMTIPELVRWVETQRCPCITITGGEPTLQAHLPELLDALATIERVDVVEIETNGSVDLAPLAEDRPAKLQFTMDYKLPSSGMEAHMLPDNLALLDPRDVVKFVIGGSEDFDRMLAIIDEYDLAARCQIFLSPVFGQVDPAALVDLMKDRLTCATLQLQLHKIIWPGQERGV